MPSQKVSDTQILASIDAYQRVNGYAPAFTEICRLTGLASVSSVAYRLSCIERLGLMTREPNKPRTLRITSAGYDSITAYSEA